MKLTLASFCRSALVALGLIALSVAAPTIASATDAAKKSPALPVTTAIEKSAPGEHGGPFAVVVVNTSTQALKLKATVHQSVVSHPNAKNRDLPPHTLEPGKSWKIDDLAVEDKVHLSADGFEALLVKVPEVKK